MVLNAIYATIAGFNSFGSVLAARERSAPQLEMDGFWTTSHH